MHDTGTTANVGLTTNSWLERFQTSEVNKIRRRRRIGAIDRVVFFLVLLGLWQAVVSLGWVNPFFTSSPVKIAVDLGVQLSTPGFYGDIAITLGNSLAGLVIGVALGTAAGLLLALFTRAGRATEPVLVAFNSLPRVALAPLFVVWLGFGPSPKILLAAFSVFFLVFFNVLSGIEQVDPSLVWNLRVLRLSQWTIVRKIYLPSAGIWVVAAMKNAISLAVTAAVVAEFVGSTAGLGHEMTNAIALLNTTRMFSVLVVLMVIGLALFSLITWAERRLLRWR